MLTKALKTATVALNHEKIGKNSQKISKTKPFINNYNRKWINYPSGKDDWKKFEKNNQGIALKVLYVKKMTISPAYTSKCNSNHEKQIILLILPNGEGWHYIAVKEWSALLKECSSQYSVLI